MTERPESRELFATQEDIDTARQIVLEELGPGYEVNYTDLTKNVGVMGDERVFAHSVVISSLSANMLNPADEKDGERLERTMLRICNETRAASRVLLDITPDNIHFEVDP